MDCIWPNLLNTYVLIYTMRGDAIRVISLRKALKHERKFYDSQT